jgi:hypothetical protein
MAVSVKGHDKLARRRAVKGWIFRDLTEEEESEIRSFLEGGPVPDNYKDAYNTCREELGMEPIAEYPGRCITGKIREAIKSANDTIPTDEMDEAYQQGKIDALEKILRVIELSREFSELSKDCYDYRPVHGASGQSGGDDGSRFAGDIRRHQIRDDRQGTHLIQAILCT